MLIVLSPSKSMEMEGPGEECCTQPAFLDRSARLVERLRGFTKKELMAFMEISEPLGELNRKRFQEWKTPFTPNNAGPALQVFTGDVYDGLDAGTLQKSDLQHAQKHLRILSGLYGLLRPLDLIQPYRLEMGRPLQMPESRNLYEFWRETITAALNAEKDSLLVNLASQEYFKAIDTKALNKRIITPVFKDEKNGKYRIVSFYAKKARGAMARFLITNRVQDAEGLHAFTWGGYGYSPALSSDDEPVFTRPQQ